MGSVLFKHVMIQTFSYFWIRAGNFLSGLRKKLQATRRCSCMDIICTHWNTTLGNFNENGRVKNLKTFKLGLHFTAGRGGNDISTSTQCKHTHRTN
jgi:hypothetical protein